MPPEPDRPDRTTVYRGLPGDGLEDFVRQFSRAAAGDPFGTWLIVPTERLVRRVTETLARNGVPFIPSRICTLSKGTRNFCRYYFEEHRTSANLISRAESGLLLRQILYEHREELPVFFMRKRPPGSGTIEELQQFISVIKRRKIAFPECLLDLQGLKSDQINSIQESYLDRLRDLDLLDSDTVLEWTIDSLSPGTTGFGHIFVYGLFDPEPLEQDLLLALRICSQLFSQFIPSGSDPALFQKPEPWLGGAANSIIVPAPSPEGEAMTGLFANDGRIATGGNVRVLLSPSRDSEIHSIAEEICRLREEGIPFSSIAVAFPDLLTTIPMVAETFADFGIPWNSSTGIRLSRSPVIGFLTGILRLVSLRYPREDVVRLVGSPYFPRNGIAGLSVRELDLVSRLAQVEGEKSGWLHGLERFIARTGEEDPAAKEMAERVLLGVSQLFEELRPLEGTKPVDEYRKNFLSLMGRWGFIPAAPGFASDEQKALEAFEHCLAGISRSAGLFPNQNAGAGDFLEILKVLSKETEIPASDDPAGVLILAFHGCVHEHFPVLFLAGLTEGDVPHLTTRLPFTNTRENARMGTRSLGEILREERYYFLAALLAGRDRVYLSAPLSDGEKMLLSSAFFERVREKIPSVSWGEAPELSHSRYSRSVRAGTLIGGGDVCDSLLHLPETEKIDELVGRVNIERFSRKGEFDSPYEGVLTGDEAIAAILAGKYGPEHIWSPTVLETYAACPFRFFVERVIGIKPLPDVEPNLSPKDRGTAVHAVLSTFYREWRASGRTKVTGSNLAEATAMMIRIAAAELDRFSFESPLWDATRIQMTGGPATGPGIFVRFLENEAEEESSALVPSLFEFSFGMPAAEGDDPASVPEPAGLSAGDGSETIRIKGRIDRIDITPDGRFSIFDYKTGSALVSRKEIEAGKALQLPLYLSAYEQVSGKRGVAAGYYRIRREVENKLVLLDEPGRELICSSRPRPTPDFRNVLNHSIGSAADSVNGIRSGVFPLVQEEKCPNAYCEFRFVCRFDPARVFSLSPEVD